MRKGYGKSIKNNKIMVIGVALFLIIMVIPLVHGQQTLLYVYNWKNNPGYDYAEVYDDHGNWASITVNATFLNDTSTGKLAINLWAYANTTFNGDTHFLIQIFSNVSGIKTFYTPTYIITSQGLPQSYQDLAAGFAWTLNESEQDCEVHLLSILNSVNEVNYSNLPLNITVEVKFLNDPNYPAGYPEADGYGIMTSSLIVGTVQQFLNNGGLNESGKGGGSCVSGSTPILTANYTYILAQDISAGDELMTYNMTTGQLQPAMVKEVLISYENSSYVINGYLEIAGDQAVLTERGFIDASNLTLNDTLYDPITNTTIPVFSIEKVNNPIIMYDFVLLINHNFIGWEYVLADKIANPCG